MHLPALACAGNVQTGPIVFGLQSSVSGCITKSVKLSQNKPGLSAMLPLPLLGTGK